MCFDYCWIPAPGSVCIAGIQQIFAEHMNEWSPFSFFFFSWVVSLNKLMMLIAISSKLGLQRTIGIFTGWLWYVSVRWRNSRCDWKCVVAMSSAYPFLLCLSFGACEKVTSPCSPSSQAWPCSGAEVKHVTSRPKPLIISARPSSSALSPEQIKCSRRKSYGMAGPLFSLDPTMLHGGQLS